MYEVSTAHTMLKSSTAEIVPCREVRGVCFHAIAEQTTQACERFITHTQLHRMARYCEFFIFVLLSAALADAVIHHAMRACIK